MALKKCKECGNENATDAKACPKCGTSLKMGWGKKTLIAFGVLVVLSAALRPPERQPAAPAPASAAAFPPAVPAPAASAGADIWAEEKPVRVEIGALLAEYRDNEVRADGAFKDKLVTSTGVVGDVKKDIANDPYVTIGTGKAFEVPVVQCMVAADQVSKVARLSRGDRVKFTGRVSGLSFNVIAWACRFE